MTTVRALRMGELLVDADTGEILSEVDYGLDELALFLKDGQEQAKAWDAYVGVMKSAIGRKLDELGLTRAETPHGTATWRTQLRYSANAADVPAITERFGLHADEVATILQTAKTLDPKLLAELAANNGVSRFANAVADLIQEKTVTYVQLMPLRRAAPRIEPVELEMEEE